MQTETQSPDSGITLSQAELVAVFETWENNYRADPAEFVTAEEAAAMAVASLSEGRAIGFQCYLRQARQINGGAA